MTLKNRIYLIVAGTIVFLVLAPVVVLGALGYYFDSSTHSLVKTGALSIYTDPRGADVLLNGALEGTTQFSKRFLLPGDYEVETRKSGYLPWKKKIAIRPQKVVGLPEGGGKIYLLYDAPKKTETATTTTAFINPNPSMPQSQYYIATSTNSLMFKNAGGSADDLVSANLPRANRSQIIATTQKQIFLLLDSDLYLVGQNELTKINFAVAYVYWNVGANALVYGNEHEIWLYHADGDNELITRQSPAMGEPIYRSGIGWFFYAGDNKIRALEYDPTGQPNAYTLAQTKSAIVPIQVSDDGSELKYLDDGKLVTLKIR